MDISNIDLQQVGKRLMERRKELGITQTELAERVALSPASVSKYENGKVAEASAKILTEFAKALNVPVWSLLGLPMSAWEQNVSSKRIPVLGKTAAGIPIFAVEEHDEYAVVAEDERVDFAARVEGNSMINARIFDGDLVFAKDQSSVSNGEIAVVRIEEGAEECYITTKRFYKYGNTIVLRSENPAYEDIEISKKSGKNVVVLGKVIFLKGAVR